MGAYLGEKPWNGLAGKHRSTWNGSRSFFIAHTCKAEFTGIEVGPILETTSWTI